MAWSTAFLSWAAGPDTVEQVLEHEPAAVMLSFGTRAELSEPVQQSPAKLICRSPAWMRLGRRSAWGPI